VREEYINEVRAEEKAQMQAQKKDTTKSKTSKALLVRNKTPAKPMKALTKQKKQVRFISSNDKEGVVATPVKSTSRGRAIKPRVMFE
jgi:phage/plasmid primase-like uncharacterized protein